jgi:hypothetical protein
VRRDSTWGVDLQDDVAGEVQRDTVCKDKRSSSCMLSHFVDADNSKNLSNAITSGPLSSMLLSYRY